MLKNVVALQKQARADAKKETPKGSSANVDPLLKKIPSIQKMKKHFIHYRK